MLELDFDDKSPSGGGCIIGLSNADYHARPELSCSNIKTLLKNPYEFLAKIKKESSKAMDFGSCVHKLILEPEDFDKEFAIMPKIDGRTAAGKEAKAAFDAKNIGKIIIDDATYDNAKQCAEIAQAIAGRFLKNGVAEQSFFGEIDGIAVKCRPDYYVEELGLIVDVKTTQDASPDGFIKSVANFGYYIQDPFYTDVLRSLGKPVNKFLFLAIETKPPFMIGMFEIDDIAKDFGRGEYKRAFNIYRRLDEFNAPVYKDTTDGTVVQTLSLPNYLFYKKGASL